MKIISAVILGFCTFIASAERTHIPLNEEAQRKVDETRNIKMLAELGLPAPGSGIKIVPRASLNLTEEQLKQTQIERDEIARQGYINKYTTRPRELLNMRKEFKKEMLLFHAKKQSVHYSGLSPSVKDLTLAFKFKGIKEHKGIQASSFNNDITLLGATIQGGFHDDKGGWSGAAQFFNVKGLGTCDYSVMNVKASNTAAHLAEEDVTYYINKKPTINFVEGNPESGFLYKVEWYDTENFHELNCASMTYSADTNIKVIDLAVKLDNN